MIEVQESRRFCQRQVTVAIVLAVTDSHQCVITNTIITNNACDGQLEITTRGNARDVDISRIYFATAHYIRW